MKKNLTALLIIAGLLAIMESGAAEEDPVIYKAKKTVADQMMDPGAVQFRDVVHYTRFNREIVCGSANAKNVYGAYTGFKRFIFIDGRVHYSDRDPPSFKVLWEHSCTAAIIPSTGSNTGRN